jgi:hypothetical protein
VRTHCRPRAAWCVTRHCSRRLWADRPRSRRRPRAGRSEAGAYHRRGRRPQPVDAWTAGHRQVDARAAAPRPPAADERRGIARRRRDRVARRSVHAVELGRPAFSRSAPHIECGRAHGRRQRAATG